MRRRNLYGVPPWPQFTLEGLVQKSISQISGKATSGRLLPGISAEDRAQAGGDNLKKQR